MRHETKLDKWGYEVNTCSDSCISAINSYYHEVLSYGRKRSVILDAPKSDPECVLGNILAAYYLIWMDPSRSGLLMDAAKSNLEHATAYEKAVYEAVVHLLSPDRDDDFVVELHKKLLQDFPRDLASLKRVQMLCFYMGRPDISLKLVEQVLPVNDSEDYVYGMLAFPLLELGRMEDAEEAGKKLCHVYQYQCRFREAVEFMENCSSTWNSLLTFMITHNWWHVALCYMEGNAPLEKARYIYDEHILKELEKSDATPAEVYLHTLGLLLHVYLLDGLDVFGDRLMDLSERITDQTLWFIELHLDVMILWGLSHTGKVKEAEDLLNGLKSRFSLMTKKKQLLMKKPILLAEAVYEYGRGNDKVALELPGHEFNALDYKMIGASDEQLDVFIVLHIRLLMNSGEAQAAIQAIKKQLKQRERSPFLWSLLEKAYTMLGSEEAASCGKKARELKAKYFV